MIDNRQNRDFKTDQDTAENFELLDMKNTLSPKMESLKIIAVYVTVGLLWVLLSDNIINGLVEDRGVLEQIQIYKGWIYVVVTGLVFYSIILKKMNMFEMAIDKSIEGYDELGAAYEELIAMESELSDQYDQIKLQKEELIISSQKHELVLEGANDGIWEWNLETGRYTFSDSDKKMLGSGEESVEIDYDIWKKYIYTEDRAQAIANIESYIESGTGLYENIYRIKTKNGDLRWILSRGKAIWDEHGKPIMMAGSHTDITERVKLEERLRKEKKFSENIIRESPVIVVILDNDLNIKRMNPFAEKMTGYSEKEVQGKNSIELFVSKTEIEDMSNRLKHFAKEENDGNRELEILRKDKSRLTVLWNASLVHGEYGKTEGIIFTGVDISERRKLEHKLNRLAYYDALTDLPNRVMLEKHFSKKLNEIDRVGKKIAFIYMDIDNFKNINDTMGHTMGDTFIASIAEILSEMVKYPNMVGRLSGDEFAILIFDIEREEDVEVYTESILSKFKQSWILDNQEFFLSTSIGVAMYPEHGESLEMLMQNADTAMFHVKEHGKDAVAFYRPDMRDKTWKHIFMSNHLRNAILNHEFFMVYQPQVDLKTERIVGVEGLIRWIHPEKGFISPGEFIPFAEETGYIKEITDWTLDVACRQVEIWKAKGYSGFEMSVNLSSKLLNQPGLMEKVKEKIKRYNIEPKELCLEITETAIIDNLNKSIETLNEFKKIGVTVALDDFGTGYSSLTYLHKLPIDILKVDREFLVDIVDADHESYIFKSIMGLAHNMGLEVIAEGIETEGQSEFLKKANCDIAQGYFFSKPVSAHELEKLLDVQDNM